jgi:hypothetical protein
MRWKLRPCWCYSSASIDANTIYVLGQDGKLWLEHGPFNSVPPPRQQVDGNVAAFDPVDGNNIYVLGSDGKFWLEFGPFGRVPPNRQIVTCSWRSLQRPVGVFQV